MPEWIFCSRSRDLFAHWYVGMCQHFPRFTRVLSTRNIHGVKSVRIRSYSGLISLYSVQMLENTGKMRTRITPNTDSFYSVLFSCIVQSLSRFKSFTKISIIIILYIPQRSLVGSIDSCVYSIDSCKTSILMGITWTEIRKKP